jgi:peptide/nickel transport system permease protein
LLPRIALLPVVWFIATVAIYMLFWVITDPVETVAPQDITDPERKAIEAWLDIEGSHVENYLIWIGNLVSGDFGESLFPPGSIREQLQERYGATLELVLLSLLFALLIGAAVGTIGARAGGVSSVAYQVMIAFGGAVPLFYVLTLALILPSVWWEYTPPGFEKPIAIREHPWNNLRHFVPPAFLLGLCGAPQVARVVRGATLRAKQQRCPPRRTSRLLKMPGGRRSPRCWCAPL